MTPSRATMGTPRKERMSGWPRPPAMEARMAVDVGGAKRLRRLEHRAEQPVRTWERPHRRDELVAHARGKELTEPAVAVGQPQRGVAGRRELARTVHEALQHLLDRELGGHGQHGVADGLECGAERGHAPAQTRWLIPRPRPRAAAKSTI